MAVAWPYAYLADQSYGLHIVDVSNPSVPQPAGIFVTGGDATGVTAAGDMIYAADGAGGLIILCRQQRAYVPIVLRNW